jgi:hypothetical protein
MSTNYQYWKRSELTKRRWVFATEEGFTLVPTGERVHEKTPYEFRLPSNCLRPIRTPATTWVVSGRNIYTDTPTSFRLDYIRDADESEFDPLFVGVLAARAALGSVEYVTQSNTKTQNVATMYDDAVEEAALANAFIIGPTDPRPADDEFAFLAGRF